MKSKIIAIAIALMLSLTACTPQNGDSSVSEATTSSGVTETTEPTEGETEAPTEPITEATTEPETEPVTEAPKEDLKEFLTPTSATTKAIDDELVKIAESKGLEVARTEENISFSGTQTIFSEIAEEYRNKLKEMSKGSEDDDDYISHIEIDDNYKSVTFYVEDGFENSFGALALLLYLQPMGELQMLDGTLFEDVHYNQKVVNVNTQEVISEAVMPDALEKEE